MSLQLLVDVPEDKKFAPRVDGTSLVVEAVPGSPSLPYRAAINKTSLTVNSGIVYWNATAGRFVSSAVTATQLNVLDVTAGTVTANKALVVDGSKNISQLGTVGLSTLNATAVNATRMAISTGSVGTLTVSASFVPVGVVSRNLRLQQSYSLVVQRGSTDRNAVRRTANTDNLIVGNTADNLYLETKTGVDIIHTRGTSSGKVWTALNDGAGSTLDADLLDGQEGSYYRNADNLNAGTVSMSRLSSGYIYEAATLAAFTTGSVTGRRTRYGACEVTISVTLGSNQTGLLSRDIATVPVEYRPKATSHKYMLSLNDHLAMPVRISTAGVISTDPNDASLNTVIGDTIEGVLSYIISAG